MDQKGSAAILVIKWSAGVAPEVNLRNPLHADNEAHKQELHPGFDSRADITRSPKLGPHKKTDVLQKFLKRIVFFETQALVDFNAFTRSLMAITES